MNSELNKLKINFKLIKCNTTLYIARRMAEDPKIETLLH
jgi:hypothetical protein